MIKFLLLALVVISVRANEIVLHNQKAVQFNDSVEVDMEFHLPFSIATHYLTSSVLTLHVNNSVDNIFGVSVIRDGNYEVTLQPITYELVYTQISSRAINKVKIVSHGQSFANITLTGKFLVSYAEFTVSVMVGLFLGSMILIAMCSPVFHYLNTKCCTKQEY